MFNFSLQSSDRLTSELHIRVFSAQMSQPAGIIKAEMNEIS